MVLSIAGHLLGLLSTLARAEEDHLHLLPEVAYTRSDIATWEVRDGESVSPTTSVSTEGVLGGTRVALVVEDAAQTTADGWRVRGVGVDGTLGPWRLLQTTWQLSEASIAIVDLDGAWPQAELRVPTAEQPDVLRFELIAPAFPDAGATARAAAAVPRPWLRLRSDLAALGVTSRASWGARPTTCTAPENDWYRMAIHHTAGAQTSGGSVRGQVQFLQAYAQDSGEYCDTPYQFLVGYDGSLWEGRALDWLSGATGGGNNDGNIAVSFMGCYHTPASACPGGVSHAVPAAMVDGGHKLVQHLVDTDNIPSDSNSIRGHRDWPGNATACPGDTLYPYLPELRLPYETFGAVLVGNTFTTDGTVRVQTGAQAWGTLSFSNIGAATWQPTTTRLGLHPHDTSSPVADASWFAPGRPASVAAATAPGQVGTFTFAVTGWAPGTYVLDIGLVEEGRTWFDDDLGPWPGDVPLTVVVEDPPPPEQPDAPPPDDGPTAADTPQDTDNASGQAPPDEASPSPTPGTPPALPIPVGGCGCDTRGLPSLIPSVPLAYLFGRRRRWAASDPRVSARPF
jgi:hypothetical protein